MKREGREEGKRKARQSRQKNLRRYPATFGRKGITNGSASHANAPKVAPHRHCGSGGDGGGGGPSFAPSAGAAGAVAPPTEEGAPGGVRGASAAGA